MKNWMSISAVALFLTGLAAMALAQETLPNAVQCGDVLGPGGVYFLDDDLECDESPALTVRDGAHLDLNGHTVSCIYTGSSMKIGIQLDGKKASIDNGTVFACDAGIVLQGSGRHSVSRIEYTRPAPGAQDGFIVLSDRNRLVDNIAYGCDFCFSISGDKNRLMRNYSFNAAGEGYVLNYSAENNFLLHNVAEDEYAGGFLIDGEKNNLIMNKAIGTLWENGAGFVVRGYGNRFWRNRSVDNNGYGFQVYNKSSRLQGNVAEDNRKSGIHVYGTDNVIVHNKTMGNGDGVNFFDLYDNNQSCDNNTWKKNKFDTRNAECIE